MLGLRFRILHSDVEEFVREIVVPSECTFEEFHKCLLHSVGFAGNELASFFITDKDWNKKLEITLMDMMMGEEEHEPTLIMSDCILGNYVDEPHQRLLFEYDFLNVNTFYCELIDTIELNDCHPKAVCTSSKGEVEKIGASFDELLDAELLKGVGKQSDSEEDDEIGDMFDEFTEGDVYQ